jgi:lysophospholipid acyltransferase (LPLAT)-like uncharacterized protein
MKIRSPFLNKLVAYGAVYLMRLLFLTTRTEVQFRDPASSCYGEPVDHRRYAFCLWHDAIALASFAKTPRQCGILVSRHNDGGLLAAALQKLGLKPFRGSSSRGGAQAAKRMIEETKELHFTITPDGPRGPRREVKDGIVFLASKTQHPVVPTYAIVTRSWSIKGSWTDMVLPQPFAKCILFGGTPIEIPADVTKEQIAEYRVRLQNEMEQLQRVAEHYVATGELDYEFGFEKEPIRPRLIQAA